MVQSDPADLDGRVHHDRIILNAQFNFAGTTMTELACQTRLMALTLYSMATANQVRAAFAGRGILSAAPAALNC